MSVTTVIILLPTMAQRPIIRIGERSYKGKLQFKCVPVTKYASINTEGVVRHPIEYPLPGGTVSREFDPKFVRTQRDVQLFAKEN